MRATPRIRARLAILRAASSRDVEAAAVAEYEADIAIFATNTVAHQQICGASGVEEKVAEPSEV
jgi:hypothetical protein